MNNMTPDQLNEIRERVEKTRRHLAGLTERNWLQSEKDRETLLTMVDQQQAEIERLKRANARHVINHIERICPNCGHNRDEDGQCANCMKAEIERLKAGGCARDQTTTQFCAEAVELQKENDRLKAALEVAEKACRLIVEDFAPCYCPTNTPTKGCGYCGARAALAQIKEVDKIRETLEAPMTNPKRAVFMFKPRFAPLVEAGKKKQTIRPLGKRRIEPGMIADCREWTGKPYHSKQRKLFQGKIVEVKHCEIRTENILLEGCGEVYPCSDLARHKLAKADGFNSWPEMRDWFEKEHGLPFRGRLIIWE